MYDIQHIYLEEIEDNFQIIITLLYLKPPNINITLGTFLLLCSLRQIHVYTVFQPKKICVSIHWLVLMAVSYLVFAAPVFAIIVKPFIFWNYLIVLNLQHYLKIAKQNTYNFPHHIIQQNHRSKWEVYSKIFKL